jgi:long-subunit fatty acid transport protein
MKRHLLTAISLLSIIAYKGFCQDAHYWQSEFCPGGYLFPGSAVANNCDSGLFYYNPALMAIHPKTSVSVSGNIYDLEIINIKDGVGSGKPLKSVSPRIIPAMVSGTIAFKRNKTISLGYALVQNSIRNFKVTQRQDKQMNVLDDSYSPGNEIYVGQYVAHNSITQTLAMASVAVKLNDRFSVGLSGIVQIRSQDLAESYKSRALSNADTLNAGGPLASVTSDYQLKYYHVGLQFKGGLSYDAGRHHFGLLITAPLITIKGKATMDADLEVSDLRIPQTNIDFNLLANDRQTGLPVKYKQPLSIALAYALDYGNGQISIAAEYFNKMNTYNIFTPRNESFIRPDTGSVNSQTQQTLGLIDKRRSVVNFSIGGSYRFNESISGVIAFRTDFNYAAPPSAEYEGNSPNTVTWDNYHLQLGGYFRRRKFNLHGGLLLNYGSTNKYLQHINFDNPNEGNFLLGDVHNVKATSVTLGFLLSYIHSF